VCKEDSICLEMPFPDGSIVSEVKLYNEDLRQSVVAHTWIPSTPLGRLRQED
jgi:hypothetical protein